MVAVILAEPENPGNIGAVCRAMANFGFDELVLIEPRCDVHAPEVRMLAKHAQHVLAKMRVATWDVLDEYGLVAATAGVPVTDYNLLRTPLTPEQGAARLAAAKASTKHKGAALLFGRESTGLTNAELARADFVITIPTHRLQPSMNLSHSVAVVLYVLARQRPEERFTPLPAHERKILIEKLDRAIDDLPFPRADMRVTQKRLWRSILGRAALTRREAFAFFGFIAALGTRRGTSATSARRGARAPSRRSR